MSSGGESPSGNRLREHRAVLADLRLENFRCFEQAALEFHPRLNLFRGGNGAGKTSLLEAIYLLSRGRSFRNADLRKVICLGYSSAGVAGKSFTAAGSTRLKVTVSSQGLDAEIDGQVAESVADLAALLPVQIIDGHTGELVEGGPESRRRLLDWGVFHVEHDFLPNWRRLRRLLAQRNAALRGGADSRVLDAFEAEMSEVAGKIDRMRATFLEQLCGPYTRLGQSFLGTSVGVTYQRGWPEAGTLASVLRESREGDQVLGYTRWGPQRADLKLRIGELGARAMSSRGQQKLLGSALVLAQCELLAQRQGRSAILLLDEPAADLDQAHFVGLLQAVLETEAQVFVTGVAVEPSDLSGDLAVFHVEHGAAKALL